MIRINLLEDERLGPEPAVRGPRRQTKPAAEPVSTQREQSPDREKTPAGVRRPATESYRQPEYRPPSKKATSSIYQGPSLAILIFLIIIGIGVAVYFLYLQNVEDLSILGPSIPEQTIPGESEVFRPEQPVETPQEEPSAATDFPVRDESDLSDILQHIAHGKKILNSSSRVFSQVNDRSFIHFFSISDEHLSLSAITRTPGFVDNIRAKIEGTSIIADIPLFSSSDYSTASRTWIELNVYANITGISAESTAPLQNVNLGEARQGLKQLISLGNIQIQKWQTIQASAIDGWMRGFVYAEIRGNKSDILRVLDQLQTTNQNISISKVFVSSAYAPPQFGDQYIVKLYTTIYGQTVA